MQGAHERGVESTHRRKIRQPQSDKSKSGVFTVDSYTFFPTMSSDRDLYPSEDVLHQLEKQGDTDTAFGDKSPGVRQIEVVAKSLSRTQRYVLWVSVFLTAYSYTLDLTVRYTYQNFALSAFSTAAQISTVAVVRSIVAAAAQPLYAKISDYFGRLSILFIAVTFYLIGTIVQAASKGLSDFLGGAVLYQFGYTGVQREQPWSMGKRR